MEYLFIYCLQLFDFCHNFKIFLALAIVISFPMYLMALYFGTSEYMGKKEIHFNKTMADLAKNITLASIFLFILFTLLPTKNTLLLVGGTYYGKKAVKQVVTSDKLQKVDTIINLELDKRIKELKNAR